MKTKRIYSLVLTSMLSLVALGTPATLSIEEFNIKAGEEKEMVIDLNNQDDEITLVQFDLRLPEGLSLKQAGSEYEIDMCDRTSWRKHLLDANATDGVIRFLLSSISNTVISGTEGGIIKLTLVADGNYKGGKIVLENILLVTPNEKEIKPENVEIVICSDIATYVEGTLTQQINNAPVFSLSGLCLPSSQKGINIIGGKKFS